MKSRLIALLAMSSAVGRAEPEPPQTAATEPGTTPVAPEPAAPVVVPAEPITADDVRDAPRPGQEHGRTDPIDHGDSVPRKIGRAALWIPRLPFELTTQPVRGLLYLQDRFKIVQGMRSQFSTDDRKIAIFPTALIETGFGLNAGMRARFRDAFGGGERIDVRAGFGGQFKRIASLDIDTSKRPGLIAAGLDARYELRDEERFFGYGNTDAMAIEGRYRLTVRRVAPRVQFRFPAGFRTTLTSALISKEFGPGETDEDSVVLADAYNTDQLPGYRNGTDFLYGELELAWDTRRIANPYDAPGIRSTGGLALVYVGRQEEVGDGPRFFRIGTDLQRYVRLTAGPRMLEFRFRAEMVTGDRDEVPFTELPQLGGRAVLRGYEIDRFRDRIAAVTQASYRWALGNHAAANVFVDAGRVYSSFDDITLAEPRIGYGAALEAYSTSRMLVRAEIATSIDGGVFVYLALNPAFDTHSRVEEYHH